MTKFLDVPKQFWTNEIESWRDRIRVEFAKSWLGAAAGRLFNSITFGKVVVPSRATKNWTNSSATGKHRGSRSIDVTCNLPINSFFVLYRDACIQCLRVSLSGSCMIRSRYSSGLYYRTSGRLMDWHQSREQHSRPQGLFKERKVYKKGACKDTLPSLHTQSLVPNLQKCSPSEFIRITFACPIFAL